MRSEELPVPARDARRGSCVPARPHLTSARPSLAALRLLAHVSCLTYLFAGTAHAQEPARVGAEAESAPDAVGAKRLARTWFDRGLVLYNSQDYAGALAEFQRAFDLVPHAVVMLNVALTYARLNQPVECVRSAERLLAMDTSKLDPSALRALQLVIAEQRARIAELVIKSNVQDVAIQVDGIDVGKAPIATVQVPAGEHVVSATATGHIPRRLRVHLEPRSQRALDIQLQPLERALAHLHISSEVPEAEVWVDGELCGRTPLPASLAFSPGAHEIELRRAGYLPVRRRVNLDPGSTGDLTFRLLPDPAASREFRGVLTLDVDLPHGLVLIDGEPQAVGKRRFELPRGAHRLQVKHEGFIDYVREVNVAPNGTTIDLELQPTPAWLDAYVERAHTQRNWALVGMISGGALAALGGGFLVWNASAKSAAEREFNAFTARVETLPGGRCDEPACDAELEHLGSRLSSARSRDALGWIGVGVGGALLGLSTGLYAFSDDPERYAPSRDSDVFGRLRLEVGPGQATLQGTF